MVLVRSQSIVAFAARLPRLQCSLSLPPKGEIVSLFRGNDGVRAPSASATVSRRARTPIGTAWPLPLGSGASDGLDVGHDLRQGGLDLIEIGL